MVSLPLVVPSREGLVGVTPSNHIEEDAEGDTYTVDIVRKG
jgi:hypothetical protein